MKKIFYLLSLLILLLASTASAEFFSDVIVTSPNGIWTDSRTYTTLNDAITAVGANQRTITIVEPEVVTALTIPANVTLRFERNGSITNSGQLTINTKNIEADNHQIFTGIGDIDFANGTIVKSSWFSELYEAFDVTSDDSLTMLVTAQAHVDTTVALGNNVKLKWDSPNNIIIVDPGVVFSNVSDIEAGNYQIFAGTGDYDFLDGTCLKLDWFSSLRTLLTQVEDEEVTIVVTGTNIISYDSTSTTNEKFDLISEQGQFSIDVGRTLTIDSPSNLIAQPIQQIFTGSGTVAFTKNIGFGSVAWWGASTSSTSNEEEIQAAFTACNCIIPDIYEVDGTSNPILSIPSNRIIKGYGRGVSGIKLAASNASASTIAIVGTASGSSNITLHSFTIDGNHDNQTWAQVTDGNLEIYTDNIHVYDMELKEHTANGIHISTGSSNLNIHDNYIHDNAKNNIYANLLSNASIIGNHIYNSGGGGISTQQAAGKVVIADNFIYDNGGYGITYNTNVVDYTLSRDWSIIGNHIYGNNAGIYFLHSHSTDTDYDMRLICSLNNIYDNTNTGVWADTIKGLICTNNIIKKNGTYGIMIYHDTSESLFAGNIISDNCQDDTALAGIWLFTDAGNVNNVIENNILFDSQASPTMLKGIVIGVSTGNIVRNNSFINITTNSIDNYTVDNANRIYDNYKDAASGTMEGNVYGGYAEGTIVWNPGDLADGAGETSAGITVTGAALGDFVLVAAPYDLQDCIATAYVQAANTVEIRLQNETGGNVNLASGTWKVKVIK